MGKNKRHTLETSEKSTRCVLCLSHDNGRRHDFRLFKTSKVHLTAKVRNRDISSERVPCENVIAMLKRFKIIADGYRNRRRRFALRFFLIAAIHNMELKTP